MNFFTQSLNQAIPKYIPATFFIETYILIIKSRYKTKNQVIKNESERQKCLNKQVRKNICYLEATSIPSN